LISIDQDGNVSIVKDDQNEEYIEASNKTEIEQITVELWQWLITLFGIVFVFLIIRSSLTNIQY